MRGLTKKFGSFTAVDALDLDVSTGEIYVLLGPNGAGKTTTLRMIAGVIPPTSGDIVLAEKNMARFPVEVKSNLFFIPDRPYLYEKLTGREYLEFLINIYRRGVIVGITPILTEFDILDRLDHLIESYSHGMRQKLLLAAAFMLDPMLLIVDEPLVGLDPRSAGILRGKFVEFVRRGHLALISTHQLSLAEGRASRVGILHRGRMLAEGLPQEIQTLSRTKTLEEAFLTLTEVKSDQNDF